MAAKIVALCKYIFHQLVTSRETLVARIVMLPIFVVLLPPLVLIALLFLRKRPGARSDPASEYIYPMF